MLSTTERTDMTENPSTHQHPHQRLIVIGAGFAGLGMGIQLKRRGEDDFVILERADDVGGTWRDNTYPGAACDVPSHLYSFSFRPNPDWSRMYPPGWEIQQYMRDCAEQEGLVPHLHLNTNMEDASWDEGRGIWQVRTNRGVFTADYLVTGTGHLADEHFPDIPGLDGFTGHRFHSARWDHSVDLAGQRIGVVGTGASAIQVIPELAKIASELVVFQRTPAYVIPRRERTFTDGERRLFRRDPQSMRDLRSELFWGGENNYAQRRAIPQFLDAAKAEALSHLTSQVTDPGLREKLTPRYEPGCKRVLISNAYYPALTAPVTTVETSALSRLDGGRAVAASGAEYELDAIVFATGFEATEPPFAEVVHGRGGLNLSEHWQQGMQAYDSISVAGFPNLFIINGPNTSLGHNSIVYIIEAQVEYILGALDHARAEGFQVMEPTREAEDAYVERIQRNAAGTVWIDGGCQSWYVDQRSGKLTLIWPDFGYAFRDENARFSPEGYELTPAELVSAG